MKPDYQKLIFEEIKRQSQGKDSLGNIVGDILNISQDAVYRRYRGETLLTINELEKLCREFRISMDAVYGVNKHQAIFSYQPLAVYDFSMHTYLTEIRDSLKQIQSKRNPEMIITVTNMPFLQMLSFPHLIRFKLFFWAKTYLKLEAYKDIQYAYEKIPAKSFEVGLEAIKYYNQIPTKEIYDLELLRGLAREIYSNFISHQFADPSFALYLLELMDRYIDHLNAQMTVGKKYNAYTEPPANGCEYEVFLNGTVNPGTSIYYRSEDSKGLFIGHNMMSTLHTSDPNYLADTENIIERQLSNSNPISVINEKERDKFVFQLKNMVNHYRKRIELELEDQA